MGDVSAVLTAVATAPPAVAAVASAVAAHKANRTAGVMNGIEQERRREELTPEFELELQRPSESPVLHLMVRWVRRGPEEMHVTIRVLDEEGQDHRAGGPPRGVEAPAWDEFVWGPLELDPGASAQVQDRRTSRTLFFSRVNGKTWERLQVRPTRPGPWMAGMSDEDWAAARGPLRVAIDCVTEGHKPWTVLRSVDLTPRT